MAIPAPKPFVLEHPEFGFYLPGDWRPVPAPAEHQLALVSDETQSRITLSIMMIDTPEDGLAAWAEKLMRLRREVHEAWIAQPENVAKGRTFTISDEHTRSFPEFKSIEVSYAGQYTGVSLFGFVGFVTTRKVVSMFCETQLSFKPGRAGVFQVVANGFKNKLP